MADFLPPLILELRAQVGQALTGLKAVGTEAKKVGEDTEKGTSKAASGYSRLASVGKGAALGLIGGAAAAGLASIKMAASYDTATTQLVTGAGESEAALGVVKKGLLQMAPAVGEGPTALAKAMFLVESGGYHGAAGLQVMKAAAEGAKIGGADATVVANGLTTAMTDYHEPVAKAAQVTSQLIATVAAGKTNMQDLSSSLSAVLPAASAAHIGLGQVLGAMGTMTGEGISAQQSAQDLASTIQGLSNPSAIASKAMAQVGLNSTDVAKQLGQKGLTGTMSELVAAITHHMGPAGLVLESAFNQSKLAAQSANEMLTHLPKSLQPLAREYLAGAITQKQWTAALKTQPALVSSLAKQFSTTAKEAHGFSDTLKSGGGAAKTFNAVLSEMTGGSTGLNTALALTGSHMSTFQSNVSSVSSATAEAGGHVKGWALTSKDASVQLAQLTAGAQAIGVKVGDFLIPKIQAVVGWLAKHTTVVKILAGVIAGSLVIAIGAYIAKLATAAAQSVGKFAQMIAGWAGIGPASGAAAAETSAAMGEVGVAEDTLAATSEAAGAATEAAFGPIGLAIGAVVLAATLLVTHWKAVWGAIKDAASWVWNNVLKPIFGFIKTVAIDPLIAEMHVLEAIWSAVWGGISSAISAVWHGVIEPVFGFIRQHWGLVFAGMTGGLSFLIQHWRTVWGAVKSVYSSVIKPVFDGVSSAFSAVWHTVQQVLGWISGLWSKIWSGMSTAAGAAMGTVKSILNDIIGVVNVGIDAINGLIHMVNATTHGVSDLWSWTGIPSIPSIPDIPHVPYLASGGVVTSPTLAVLGEAGAEAVLPLTGAGRSASIKALPSLLGGGGSGSGMSAPSTGDVGGQVIDLTTVIKLDGKAIAKSTERHQLRTGLRRGSQHTYQQFTK